MGLFITFEGTEGSGKTTQIGLLAQRLRDLGREVLTLREPGGTPIGEEIRHTLKHSPANAGMCPETELLLVNASRAQLVREVIRPALASGKAVICDRFFDSTIAYQTFGRQLDSKMVQRIIDVAVGGTHPQLTFLLRLSLEASEQRRSARGGQGVRDRFEEEDREFFRRVERGYDEIMSVSGSRVRAIDAALSVDDVAAEVWRWVEPLAMLPPAQGNPAWKTSGECRTDEQS